MVQWNHFTMIMVMISDWSGPDSAGLGLWEVDRPPGQDRSQMQNIFNGKRNTLLYISKINTDTQEKTQVLCALPRMQKALAMDFTAFSIWFILSLKYFVKELPC